MKRLLVVLLCFVLMLISAACNNTNSEIDTLKQEIEALKAENELLKNKQPENTVKPIDEEQDMTPVSQDDKDILSTIWDFVQPEIADNLNQPTTAEFTDISKVKFYEITTDTYEVLGSVKGQNALGNMVSTNFCATVIIDSTGQPTVVSKVDILGDTDYEERIALNEQLKERAASGKTYLTAAELIEETEKQPLYVTETKYLDSSTFSYSSSSMLQAVLYNNSDVPIKNAVVAFAAWDKNNLPIKIKGYISISDGSYFSKINYDSINLMPEDTYKGKEGNTYSGMQIDKDIQVYSLKAIVISYEDFDGNTWENPLVLDFKHLYEEKRLVD